MNLSSMSIKRPVTVIMMVLMIMVLGGVAFSGLSIDLFPDVSFPMAIVMTEYPGAGPREVETLITKPLEEVLGTVNNFKKVSSTSSNGSSTVMVEFTQGTNMDFAGLQMREKIDMIKDGLPDDVRTPVVFQFDPDLMPIIQFGMSGKEGLQQLKDIAEKKVKDRLERLDGVASVSIYGGIEREIKINIIPQKLKGYGLSFDQVNQVLRAENLNMPGGKVQEAKSEFTVRTTAEFASVEEIQELPITTKAGIIHLKDVAEVVDTNKDRDGDAFMNGDECVVIAVQKQSGSNTVKVADKINKELDKIAKEQAGVNDFRMIYDQSSFIKKSIGDVALNATIGGLLSVIILYIFLRNIRTTIIIAATIPISIIATFILIYFSGITLNMMSLGGLALGIGNLVDNAIVIIECIYRYREEGYGRKEAAIEGSKEVAMPVVASTFATMAVFLPIAFIKDNATIEMFREFALTVAFSQLASLIAALTLVPMLASKLLKISRNEIVQNRSWIHRMGDKVQSVFERTEQSYGGLLGWSLKHRVAVILGTIGLFVVSIIFSVSFTGMEFFPTTDEGEFQIDVELPKGTVLSETAKIMGEIEKRISAMPNKTQYLFVLQGLDSSGFGMGFDASFGQIYGSYGSKKDRKEGIDILIDQIRNNLKGIAGAKITVKKVSSMGAMGGGGKPVTVEIDGDDLTVLRQLADQVVDQVKLVEGTREVGSSFAQAVPEARVKVDRKKAAQYGITASTIASTVQTAIMGQTPTKYKIAGDEIDVRVRMEKESRKDLKDLQGIVVSSVTGVQVPLYELAAIEIDESPTSISRVDQVRQATVTADIANRNAGAVFTDVQKKLDAIKVPAGYEVKLAGQNEDMIAAGLAMLMAFLLAILLVYMIMASQFESLLHPFTIMFTIPLSFIGVSFAMTIAHKPYSVPAFIGIIMLVGIVTNNAIVLIDYINILREKGMERNEAIKKAGPVRLRPILMTALATVIGSVPLALGFGEGGEQQAPLAITIVGGLSFATLLTLVFIPVLYTIFDDFGIFLRKVFKGKPKTEAVVQSTT